MSLPLVLVVLVLVMALAVVPSSWKLGAASLGTNESTSGSNDFGAVAGGGMVGMVGIHLSLSTNLRRNAKP